MKLVCVKGDCEFQLKVKALNRVWVVGLAIDLTLLRSLSSQAVSAYLEQP